MLVARSATKLAETCGRLGSGVRMAHFVADATDEEANAAAVAATVQAFGGVDILLANAGMEGPVAPIEAQRMTDFETVLHTNVIGVWLSMKACAAPMRARGGGSMIAVSSISGVKGVAGMAPYVASKHAVYGLVKSAALELGAAGIRVNAIGPGPIDNRMMRSIETQIAADNPDAVRDMVLTRIPLQRYGVNEDVAKLALFLASDDAAYCSGGIHMVDGGYTAG
jgi:NAD(P)-dependent dehydrogenase (short-subunit alcohol dehydrogenase family)